MSEAKAPKYEYDCKSCRFNWCCGPTCHCHLRNQLPVPPKERKLEVNATLLSKGFEPEFIGPYLASRTR